MFFFDLPYQPYLWTWDVFCGNIQLIRSRSSEGVVGPDFAGVPVLRDTLRILVSPVLQFNG